MTTRGVRRRGREGGEPRDEERNWDKERRKEEERGRKSGVNRLPGLGKRA